MQRKMIEAPPPGVYRDVPMGVYSLWDCANNSGCKVISERTPAHFKYERDNLQPVPDLPVNKPGHALAIGTAVHTLALEPENEAAHIVALPDFDYRKKDEKAQWLAIRDANPGKVWLRPNIYADAVAMVKAARDSSVFLASLLDHPGDCELSVVHDLTTADGRQCRFKARFDKFVSIGDVVLMLDIKTTEDASDEAWSKSMVKWHYYRQGGIYLDIARERPELPNPDAFVFICIEKEAPHFSKCHLLPNAAAEQGASEVRRILNTYQDCVESGEWPAYGSDFHETDLPRWFWKNAQ